VDTAAPKADLVAAAEPVLVEGLSTLFSALGVAVLVYRLTKGLGFVDPRSRDAMLPFNLWPPTNTLFQYATGLLTVIGVGALYAGVVVRRFGRVARGLDLLAATVTLLLVWWTSSSGVAVASLVARATVAALLTRPSAAAFVAQKDVLARMAAWAPPFASLVFCGFFSLVLPGGIPAAVTSAPPWLLGLVAAPFVLFAIEEWLPPAALRWERRIGLALAFFALPLFTLTVASAYFDFATIVGPVNDLLNGKDILDSVVSTYGFLFVYALAAIFRVFRVTDLFIGLAVVNSMAYAIGYGAIFGFLFYRMKRLSLCLSCMMAIVAIHHFHLHVPISWLPQSGFLRFGAMLPAFLALYALDERPRSRRFEWIFAAYCAIAMFWTIEVGGYIALGLAAALGRDLLFRPQGDRRGLRLIAKIAASAGAVLVFFCVWIGWRHGHWPIWRDLLHFQRAYSAGLAMGRLTSIERWPIPLLISLVALFATLRAPRSMRHGSAWVFLAVFGLAAMVYPLGKAGIFDLARVALPAILLVAAFVGFLYDHRERLTVGEGDRRVNLSTVACVSLLAVCALATCFVRGEVAADLDVARTLERNQTKPIAHRAPSWRVFMRTPENCARFERDLQAIESLVPAREALPMISKSDTLYYMVSHRKALFKNSFYPHFFFKSDLDDMVSALLSSQVGYVFVDNSQFQPYENRVDPRIANDVWARVASRYRLLRHAGLLDVYQRLPDTAR
jgi:hypothetical protein